MADSVTQLQNQINTLCQLMFNYAGTLQRDAKPATIGPNGELNDALTEGGVTRAEIDEMAATIAEANRVIMEIARALPEIDTDEKAARKRIAALHAEHDKVSKELETVIAQAKAELDVINAAFKAAASGVLALDEATD
uniref:Mediator of RNA polymerase II transcription subunit 21 n=1 Tax=Ostreococcus sp. 'lucimarinus' TaxID=242159 RepID=A0A7R9XTB0_9CHLO